MMFFEKNKKNKAGDNVLSHFSKFSQHNSLVLVKYGAIFSLMVFIGA
ncbi:hypothetical protein M211_1772 [Acinetobacter lactucae]|nr:hypothetical protein M211_1772 [Acinetobacter lactucae]